MATETSQSGVSSVGKSYRRATLVGGGLLVLLGIVAMASPFVTGVALAVTLGAVLVLGALLHVASAFAAGSLGGFVWQVLLGVVYAFAGISILANPVVGLATLTVLVVVFLVLGGFVELGWAVVGGADTRLWLALSGIVSLLLGALVFVGFPSSALWAVGVLFGVNLLVTGVAMIAEGRTGPRGVTSEGQEGAGQAG